MINKSKTKAIGEQLKKSKDLYTASKTAKRAQAAVERARAHFNSNYKEEY